MQRQELTSQSAVATLALTGKLVDRVLEQIPHEEWLRRPAPHLTHVLWIVGHLATTRQLLAQMMGAVADVTLNPLFVGGRTLEHDDLYPSPSAVMALWRDKSVRVDQALRTVSASDLQRPSPEGVPTFDGRVTGAVAASAFHEAYHVGQLGYLTRWLDHPPLLGR